MIPNEKYVEIAKGLLEKTKRQEAPWKACRTAQENSAATLKHGLASSKSAPEATEFILTLPKSVIRLTFLSRPYQPDAVSLKFLDKNERVAGNWTVEEGEDDWPLARGLYQEVSKLVLGSDSVLVDVEEFIGKLQSN